MLFENIRHQHLPSLVTGADEIICAVSIYQTLERSNSELLLTMLGCLATRCNHRSFGSIRQVESESCDSLGQPGRPRVH